MNDAVVKAEEFAKAITDSAEYKRFNECSKAMDGDESRRLMAKYQSKQRRLWLGRFEPNSMDEMRDLHFKISQKVMIQNFNQSSSDVINPLNARAKCGLQLLNYLIPLIHLPNYPLSLRLGDS